MIVIRLNTPEQNGTSGSDDKRQRRYLPAHALPASAPAPQTNVEIKKMLGGSMRNASQHWTRGSGGLTPTPCPEVPFCSGLAARDSVSCLLLTARHSQTRAVSALTRPDCGSRTGPLTPHGATVRRNFRCACAHVWFARAGAALDAPAASIYSGRGTWSKKNLKGEIQMGR